MAVAEKICTRVLVDMNNMLYFVCRDEYSCVYPVEIGITQDYLIMFIL
jgi:hypothetical protein